jgi:hypothetical protein
MTDRLDSDGDRWQDDSIRFRFAALWRIEAGPADGRTAMTWGSIAATGGDQFDESQTAVR